MGTTSVRHIIEAGLVAFLQAEPTLAGVNIYPGDSTALAVHPKVVVTCESARTPALMPDGLGNYDCSVRVVISDNADDFTLTQHRQHEASVLATLANEAGIKAAFAAASASTAERATTVALSRSVAAGARLSKAISRSSTTGCLARRSQS